MSNSVPSFVTEVTSGIVMLVFNFIILGLEGNTGVAAFAVITVISLVIVAIYTGLSQGIRPIISLNHGAGNPFNVKSILKYALITVLILSGVIYTIIFFGASQLVSIFNNENNRILQALAVAGLRLYFGACPFIGFNIVTATYFTSTERPHLDGVLQCICIDLLNGADKLPEADLVIANLLVEYIGYKCFQNVVRQVRPKYVSCIIQINVEDGWVSDSPYLRVFDRLEQVHHQMEEHHFFVDILCVTHYNKFNTIGGCTIWKKIY